MRDARFRALRNDLWISQSRLLRDVTPVNNKDRVWHGVPTTPTRLVLRMLRYQVFTLNLKGGTGI